MASDLWVEELFELHRRARELLSSSSRPKNTEELAVQMLSYMTYRKSGSNREMANLVNSVYSLMKSRQTSLPAADNADAEGQEEIPDSEE